MITIGKNPQDTKDNIITNIQKENYYLIEITLQNQGYYSNFQEPNISQLSNLGQQQSKNYTATNAKTALHKQKLAITYSTNQSILHYPSIPTTESHCARNAITRFMGGNLIIDKLQYVYTHVNIQRAIATIRFIPPYQRPGCNRGVIFMQSG